MELQGWIQKDSQHRSIFKNYLSAYQNSRSIGLVDSIDTDIAWRNIENKTQTSRIINIKKLLQYAAVIIIPLALAAGIWFMTQYGFKLNGELAYQPIPPGNQGAELVLSNGQVVALDADTSYQIKENDGTKIMNRAARLSYKGINNNIKKKEAIIYNTIRTKHGKEIFVELSDGTKVWINAMSTIKYPVTFEEKTRIVEVLEGEAYFEVTKNTGKPFIVRVNDYNIKVHGTSFNISSYKNDDIIHTTLIEGSVEINSIKGLPEESFMLDPNQQFSFNKSNLVAEVKEVESSNFNSWINGRFSFDDTSLEDIFKILERWYKIEVFYDDHSAKKELFTGELPRYNDMHRILNKIEYVSKVKFEVDKNIIVVTKD